MTARDTVLVTGATGLLGPYLVEAATRLGRVIVSGGRDGDVPCDLTDRSAVDSMVCETAPNVVIHAAGLTDVDRCEREPSLAYALNRETAANVATVLPAPARLVYISTDQVYPDSAGPHAEGSEVPVNVYGRSKLAGERAALARGRTLVLRVNLFGPSRTPGKRSLSDFVAENLAAGNPITLFDDVLFSPLHMASLAALVAECVERGLTGVYNLGSRDGMTKADFGLAIARRLGLDTTCATVGASPARSGRAPRSKDLRLDVGRIEVALGRAMPSLREEIAKL